MKYIVLLLTLGSFSAISQSQLGIYVGYTDAFQQYADGVEIPDNADTSIDGLNVGFVITKDLKKNYQLESRLGYIRRGAACEPGFFENPGGDLGAFLGDTDLLIDYAELPIKVNGGFSLFNEKLKLSGGIGYGISYAFNAKRVINTQSFSPAETSVEIGDGGRLKRIDHGFYYGTKLELNLNSIRLFGMAELYGSMRDAEAFNVSKNRSASFSIGVSKCL